MVLSLDKQHPSPARQSLDYQSPQSPNYIIGQLISFLDQERDQRIIWITIAFGIGSAAYFALTNEPDLFVGPTILFAVVCLKYALPQHTLVTVAIGITLSVSAGFTAAHLKSNWVQSPVLKITTRAVDVQGYVELVEPRLKGAKRLTIRPTQIENFSKRAIPRRVRITVNGNLANGSDGIKSGDFITLRAKVNPPPGPALPGGYDFARYAWFKGLGGVGYAISTPKTIEHKKVSLTFQFNTFMQTLRRSIGKRVENVLPNETGAIANALITGERGAISDATNDAYRGAGLYHILSISGLHMAIMGGAVFFLLRSLLALAPAIALRYPIKKWAASGAIVGSFAYLLISGGAFATIRSFIMIVMMFLAILVDRPAIALRNVAIAALLILCLFPESILDPGFQMSFAAVAALTVGFELLQTKFPAADGSNFTILRRRLLWPFAAIILSTLLASAAVTPFAIYHFHNAQHYAVLSNLIAMPVCNLIVMPAALGTLIAIPLGLEAAPLAFMGFGIDLMTNTATWVANLPGSVSHPPALATHVFAIIIVGGVILLVVRQTFRLVGLALIVLGIALAPGTKLPDILVGRDANLVAIQKSNGTLSANTFSANTFQSTKSNPKRSNAIQKKKPPFELVRWMEHYGDTRPAHVALAARSFRCDRIGCTAKEKDKLIALSRHPAAQSEDCRRSNIMIVNSKAPRICEGPSIIVDKYAVRRYGTHAIYIHDNGSIKIKTVAQSRGNRPWVH